MLTCGLNLAPVLYLRGICFTCSWVDLNKDKAVSFFTKKIVAEVWDVSLLPCVLASSLFPVDQDKLWIDLIHAELGKVKSKCCHRHTISMIFKRVCVCYLVESGLCGVSDRVHRKVSFRVDWGSRGVWGWNSWGSLLFLCFQNTSANQDLIKWQGCLLELVEVLTYILDKLVGTK